MSWGIVATVGVMGAGMVVNAIGRKEAAEAEAAGEMANAAYYREQAQFAQEAGERSQNIFDRETLILFGEQKSQLAAAGVGEEVVSGFMTGQVQARREERYAIGQDTEANVRLAMLRGNMSDQRASAASDSRIQTLGILGDAIGIAGTVVGGSFSKGSAKTAGTTGGGSGLTGSQASASMSTQGASTNYRIGK